MIKHVNISKVPLGRSVGAAHMKSLNQESRMYARTYTYIYTVYITHKQCRRHKPVVLRW